MGKHVTIKVRPQGAVKTELYTGSEFEKAFGVRYISSLTFGTEKLRKQIEKRCRAALEEGEISRRQKWLGSYHAKEVAEGLSPDLEIRWIDSTVGYGVFANEPFEPGAFVSEYTGVLGKHTLFSKVGGAYLFYYPIITGKHSPYYVDAQKQGNYARFINHSEQGNVKPCYALIEGVIHILLLATKKIPIGAQICYDYGELYWKRRDPPLRINP